MRHIKKTTALLLALLSLTSLALPSCGEKKPDKENASYESIESTPSSEDKEQPETVWTEWELVTEPTCTENGSKKRYSADGAEVETMPIPARGHDYSGENNTCIRCEEAIDVNLFKPTG